MEFVEERGIGFEYREVGIAGASCIGGVEVIAGLAPGGGVVAAQALGS